jgi:hypothetical protein
MENLNTLNEYGIPLHACNGYKQDAHWWQFAKWVIDNSEKVGYDGLLVYYKRKD